jgi:hypothetical protein
MTIQPRAMQQLHMTEFILYSKPGCGLCDKAKALLQTAKLEYTEINILENPEGMALYAFEIPVLVNSSGKELIKGEFTESKVAALLMRL